MTDLVPPLSVRIEAQLRKFERQMSKMQRTVDRSARGVETRARRMERELERSSARAANRMQEHLKRGFDARNLLAGAGFAFSAREIIGYADSWTQLSNKLVLVEDVMGDVSQAQEEIFRISQQTRTSLDATSETLFTAAYAAREFGGTRDQVTQFAESVALGAQIANKGVQATNGALFQLSQAIVSPRVQLQEFNSVVEGTPRLAKAFAEGIAEAEGSIAKLRKLIADGKVSGGDLFKGLLSQTQTLRTEFEQTTMTIGQSLTLVDNAIGKYIGQTDQGLAASERLAKGIAALGENIEIIAPALATLAGVITGRYVDAARQGIVATLKNAKAARVAAIADRDAALAAYEKAMAKKADARTTVVAAQMQVAAGIKVKKAKSALARAEGKLATATDAAAAAQTRLASATTAAIAATSRLARAGRALRGAFMFLGGWPTLIMAAVTAFYAFGDSAADSRVSVDDLSAALSDLEMKFSDLRSTEETLEKSRKALTAAQERYKEAVTSGAEAAQAAAVVEIDAIRRRIDATEDLKSKNLELIAIKKREFEISLKQAEAQSLEPFRKKLLEQGIIERQRNPGDNLEYGGLSGETIRLSEPSHADVIAAKVEELNAARDRLQRGADTVADRELLLAENEIQDIRILHEEYAAILENGGRGSGDPAGATPLPIVELTDAKDTLQSIVDLGLKWVDTQARARAEVGKTAGEVAALRFEAAALAQLTKDGIKPNPAIKQAIADQAALVKAAADARAASEQADKAADDAAKKRQKQQHTNLEDLVQEFADQQKVEANLAQQHAERIRLLTVENAALAEGEDAAARAVAIEQELNVYRREGIEITAGHRAEVGKYVDSLQAALAKKERLAQLNERKKAIDEELGTLDTGRLDQLQSRLAAANAGGREAEAVRAEALSRLTQLRDLDAKAAEDRLAKTEEEIRAERAIIKVLRDRYRAEDALAAAKKARDNAAAEQRAYVLALQDGIAAAERAVEVEKRIQADKEQGIQRNRKTVEAEIAATKEFAQAQGFLQQILEATADPAAKLAEFDTQALASKQMLVSLLGSEAAVTEMLAKARNELVLSVSETAQQAQAMLEALEGPQDELNQLLKDESELRAEITRQALEQGDTEAEAAQKAEEAITSKVNAIRAQISPVQAYLQSLQSPMEKLEEISARAFQGMEDALTQFVTTGKLDFSSLIDSMIADLARLAIQQMIMKPLMGSISGGGGLFGGLFAGGGPLAGYASGGALSDGREGGLIRGPGSASSDSVPAIVDGRKPIRLSNTEFIVNGAATARNMNLLKHINAGGDPASYFARGNYASGGALSDYSRLPDIMSTTVATLNNLVRRFERLPPPANNNQPTVSVHIVGAPSQPQVQQGQGADGETRIDVIFDAVEGRIARNVARGRGPLAGALAAGYGAKRIIR